MENNRIKIRINVKRQQKIKQKRGEGKWHHLYCQDKHIYTQMAKIHSQYIYRTVRLNKPRFKEATMNLASFLSQDRDITEIHQIIILPNMLSNC